MKPIPTYTLDNSDHDGSNFEDDDHSVSFSMSNISGHSDPTSLVSSWQSCQRQMPCQFRVESDESGANEAHCVCCVIVTNQICYLHQLCCFEQVWVLGTQCLCLWKEDHHQAVCLPPMFMNTFSYSKKKKKKRRKKERK